MRRFKLLELIVMNLRTEIRKYSLDISGNMMVAAMAASFVVASSTVLLSKTLRVTKANVNRIDAMMAQLANEQAKVVGGYLVSNGLVLCRQTGWNIENSNKLKTQVARRSIPADAKCIWVGDLNGIETNNEKGQQPHISPKEAYMITEYGLKNQRYERARTDDGKLSNRRELAFDIELKVNGEVVKSDLRFDLVSFENKSGREIFGYEPGDSMSYDYDSYVVMMKVITEKSKASLENGGKSEEMISVSGIRRPVAISKVNVVNAPACNYSCYTGKTTRGKASCRGTKVILDPLKDSAKMEVKFQNYGPGPLYGVMYQKLVHYNNTNDEIELNDDEFINVFQKHEEQTQESIGVLLTSKGQDSITLDDTIFCRTPNFSMVQNTTTVEGSSDRIEYSFGEMVKTQEPLAEVKYSLTPYPAGLIEGRRFIEPSKTVASVAMSLTDEAKTFGENNDLEVQALKYRKPTPPPEPPSVPVDPTTTNPDPDPDDDPTTGSDPSPAAQCNIKCPAGRSLSQSCRCEANSCSSGSWSSSCNKCMESCPSGEERISSCGSCRAKPDTDTDPDCIKSGGRTVCPDPDKEPKPIGGGGCGGGGSGRNIGVITECASN